MAARPKSDQRRDDPCAGGLRKRVVSQGYSVAAGSREFKRSPRHRPWQTARVEFFDDDLPVPHWRRKNEIVRKHQRLPVEISFP
jgi:hypothetical protein